MRVQCVRYSDPRHTADDVSIRWCCDRRNAAIVLADLARSSASTDQRCQRTRRGRLATAGRQMTAEIFCDFFSLLSFLSSVWNECANGPKIVILARDYTTGTIIKTETEMIRMKINYNWNWLFSSSETDIHRIKQNSQHIILRFPTTDVA